MDRGFLNGVITHYDIHIYYDAENKEDVDSITELRSNLIATFPQLKVFNLVPKKVGPHPLAMFESHLVNKEEFSTVIPWLCLNHKHHSCLIHPNSNDGLKDHIDFPLWLGKQLPLDASIFNKSDDELSRIRNTIQTL